MSSTQHNEMQMLKEYVASLQKQIKCIENQRQILSQEVNKAELYNSQTELELRQVKNQLKDLNSVLTRQSVQKISFQNKIKIVSEQNEKLRKQAQTKDQKIVQLNNTIKQKNDLLTAQKNNLFVANNYHIKQMGIVQEKLRELQKKLAKTSEEKALVSSTLNFCNDQISKEKQENEKLKSKTEFTESKIGSLESKVKMLEKQLYDTINEKNSATGAFQKTADELSKAKIEIDRLLLKLSHGTQSNEQSKYSYEVFISSLKRNYQKDISQLKEQIQQSKIQIQQKTVSIQNINNLLNLQRANFDRQLQKNHDLTISLSQTQKELQRVKIQMVQELKSKDLVIANLENRNEQLIQKWKDIHAELEKTISLKYKSQEELNFRLHQFEVKYDQDIRQKEQLIDSVNHKLTSKFLENEELKYDLSETRQRETQLKENLRLKQEEMEAIQKTLEVKKGKIEELSSELSEIYRELQDKTREYYEKGKQGEQISQKQMEILFLNENLRKQVRLMTRLREQKNLENKRLRTKVEVLTEQLTEMKRTQARISKQIHDYEDKLAKTMQDFANIKEASDTKLSETQKRLNEVQRQLQRLRWNYRQKEDSLRILTEEHEKKTREFSSMQQDLNKKLIQAESKFGRVSLKLSEQQKQMERKDLQHKNYTERLVTQHSNEISELNFKYGNKIHEQQTQFYDQVTTLKSQLQAKIAQVKELQASLSKEQLSASQLQANHSTMEKTIFGLKTELQDSRREINSYHEKVFGFNSVTDNIKEQLIEKEIKIVSLTALLDKTRKDNHRLLSEESLLREQVAALQSSTTYLKKQLTSTLERQQTSLKQIRTLQETNKSYSRLISSSPNANLNGTDERISSIQKVRRQKSISSLGKQFRRGDDSSELIPELVEEGKVESPSQRKNDINLIQKYFKPESKSSTGSGYRDIKGISSRYVKESIVEEYA